MEGIENSKTEPFEEQEQYTSYFSYPSLSLTTRNHHQNFSKLCPIFSTMEFNEVKNGNADANRGNFNSFTPSEDSSSGYSYVHDEDHSCAKSQREGDGDASDEEVSLDELLLDGKTKKKIELLAAMVGVDNTEPAIVLNEVVRVLKVLKRINQY